MDISMQVNPYGLTIADAPAFWQVDLLWMLLASGHALSSRQIDALSRPSLRLRGRTAAISRIAGHSLLAR